MAEVHADISLLLSRLHKFRENDRYCDVTILVDEKSFRCHRLILAATCEYFDAMFGGNFKESSAEQVTLQGIDASAFAEVLRFVYTGRIVVSAENAYSLIVASEFLKLTFIEDLCEEYLKHGFPVENAMEIFVFARATMKHSLANIISRYLIEKFPIFSTGTAVLSLPYEDFRFLFGLYRDSECTSFGNDDLLLDVIMRWIAHAREERSSHVRDLLNTIDFRSVTPGFMKSMAEEFFVPKSFTSSGNWSEFTERTAASSLHVFIRLYDVDAASVWQVFSLTDHDEWRYSCPAYITDRLDLEICYPRRGPESNMRNVSVGNYIYGLRYSHKQSVEQNFCRAPSVYFNEDTQGLMLPPTIVHSFEMCESRSNIYLYNRDIFHRQRNESIRPYNLPGNGEFNAESRNRGFYMYNLELNRWFPVPELSQKVAKACVTVGNNLIYVIGGERSGGQPMHGYLQVYDSRTSQWRVLPRGANSFVDAACCIHQGQIYVSGGSCEHTKTDIFDPVAGKWMPVAPMKKSRSLHRLISHKNRVWAMGNDCQKDLSIEVYDTITRDWCTVSALEDAVSAHHKNYAPAEMFHCDYDDHPPVMDKKIQDAVVFEPLNLSEPLKISEPKDNPYVKPYLPRSSAELVVEYLSSWDRDGVMPSIPTN